MLRVCSLVTGSSGNAYLVESARTRLLVDAGLRLKVFKEKWWQLYAPESDGSNSPDFLSASPSFLPASAENPHLDAILLTHDHADHVGGIWPIARATGAEVFCSEGTRQQLVRRERPAYARNWPLRSIRAGEQFWIGDIEVQVFESSHDAEEGLLFRFSCRGKSFAILTDTGHFSEELKGLFQAPLDFCFVEANYEPHLLHSGPYPYLLKQRIDGPRGHLSNVQAAEVVSFLASRGCGRFCLTHLSTENNLPDLALLTVQRRLQDSLSGQQLEDLRLEVAPRYECSGWYVL